MVRLSLKLQVLYEDNHLLVVNKSAGLPTMGTPADRATLLSLAKEYVKEKYQKPGNVYLGVVSRLDVPVSGAVLFARTSKSARRLNAQFRTQAVQKTYWAIAEGIVTPPAGEMLDWVEHDERHRRMRIAAAESDGVKEARLAYRRLEIIDKSYSWLEITLITGRKHQIRLQLARRGHPILGDIKYGSKVGFPAGIALHARKLRIAHPITSVPLQFTAPLPEAWTKFGLRAPPVED